MADLSNKALALVLLAAMVVSIGGTMYTLNSFDRYNQGAVGYAGLNSNQSGIVNFTINSSLSVKFNAGSVMNFGAGYVNTSFHNCTMGTNQTPSGTLNGCIGFLLPNNLTIENDGNNVANTSINFSGNATTFIGGSVPSLQYKITVNESTSCSSILNGSTWKEVDSDGRDMKVAGAYACRNLQWADASDTFDIGLWMRIPEDASKTTHTLVMYVQACDDTSC